MDDDSPFAAWFGLWKLARPQMTPIGWYTMADLEAAFNAGKTAERDEHRSNLVTFAQRTEELLRDLRKKD